MPRSRISGFGTAWWVEERVTGDRQVGPKKVDGGGSLAVRVCLGLGGCATATNVEAGEGRDCEESVEGTQRQPSDERESTGTQRATLYARGPRLAREQGPISARVSRTRLQLANLVSPSPISPTYAKFPLTPDFPISCQADVDRSFLSTYTSPFWNSATPPSVSLTGIANSTQISLARCTVHKLTVRL